MAVVLATTSASAEEAPAPENEMARASEFFFRGMELVRQERWEEALTAFDESLEIYPTQAAMFNRGLCLGLLGRPADAVAVLEEHLERYGDSISPEQRAAAEQALTTNRSRAGHVAVSIDEAPEGTRLLLDGEMLDELRDEMSLDVNPGRYQVTVEAPGYVPYRQWVEVDSGETVEVAVAMEREVEPQPVEVEVPVPVPVPVEPPPRNRALIAAGWASAGVGVILVGAAVALLLWNDTRYDEWEIERDALIEAYGSTADVPQDTEELGERTVTNNDLGSSITTVDSAGWAMLGIGAAAAITALVLFLVEPHRRETGSGVSLRHGPGWLALNACWSTQ